MFIIALFGCGACFNLLGFSLLASRTAAAGGIFGHSALANILMAIASLLFIAMIAIPMDGSLGWPLASATMITFFTGLALEKRARVRVGEGSSGNLTPADRAPPA